MSAAPGRLRSARFARFAPRGLAGTPVRALRIDFGPPRRPRCGYAAFVLLVVGMVLLGGVGWRYAGYAQMRAPLQLEHDRLLRLSNRSTHDPSTHEVREPAGPSLRGRMEQLTQALGRLDAPWDALLADVESSMDERVALLGLEPDLQQRALRLRGEARDIEAVFDFVRRIDATAMLDAAHLDQHQLNLQDPRRPVQFVLMARWSVVLP